MTTRWPLALLLAAVPLACTKDAPKATEVKKTAVQVAKPIERAVTEFEEFTGRTEAIKSVTIRSRVTGYLTKVAFKDGDPVKEGDVLFEIDRRTYDAEVRRSTASIALADARAKRLKTDADRINNLLRTKSVSQEEADRILGDYAEAQANVDVAQAGLQLARVNLDYCRITAPIAGRISNRTVDPGNLVKADETTLTTLVAQDPIYAYFDVDERTLLVQLAKIGSTSGTPAKPILVEVGLTSEEGFSIKGEVDFIDNRVDANTGTIKARAVIPNPEGLLKPGLFIRVRMPVGEPHKSVLVSEQALMSDQGNRYVYIVDAAGKVQQRPVSTGSPQGGLRVVTNGLTTSDRVIVTGLQRTKPGATVEAGEVELPGKK